MLKSFTGLEGGVVATGSTCGVVSGGAMGLALSHYDEIMEKGIPTQAGLLALVGEYAKWFGENYGSSLCRERSGVDFYTTMGQLRYFMPGDNGAATYKKLKQINSEIEVLVSSGFCKDLNVSEILKAVRIVSFRNLSNSKSLPIK